MSVPQVKVLNDSLFESNNIEKFKQEFNDSKPFPIVRIKSFLNTEFISKLESSLDENITFSKKDNDLFRFFQSYGLQELPQQNTAIQDVIKTLYSNKFRELLFKITGQRVNDKPDLFASCYNDTSYLLCHDDQIEDRKIAFILYLVPSDWNEADGGALNIYNSYTVNNNNSNSSNSSNLNTVNVFPENEPFKQLLPERNSVIIFKVSDKSFHSVDEVLTNNKNRIAIGGWWHDEQLINKQNKTAIPDPIIIWNHSIKANNTNLLQKWLNPIYLKQDSINKLKKQFLEDSHLTMMNFINDELYYKLLKQMFLIQCKKDIHDNDNQNKYNAMYWKLKGPIHRRLYYQLFVMKNNDNNNKKEDYSLILEFKELMESIEWKLYIENITNLGLLKYNMETRRFDHRHYTIAHDLDRFKDSSGLDINFQIVENEENGWNPVFGGSIYYTLSEQEEDENDDENENENEDEDEDEDEDLNVNNVEMERNKEEKEEEDKEKEDKDEEESIDDNILISIHTFPNTLSITYRSEIGVMSFVKYINHNAPSSKIDFNQIWTMNDNDESEEDENKDSINAKKRKLDDNDKSLNVEPPHKKQKV